MRWDPEFSLDQRGEKTLHVPLSVYTAKAKQYKQSSGYPELHNFNAGLGLAGLNGNHGK